MIFSSKSRCLAVAATTANSPMGIGAIRSVVLPSGVAAHPKPGRRESLERLESLEIRGAERQTVNLPAALVISPHLDDVIQIAASRCTPKLGSGPTHPDTTLLTLQASPRDLSTSLPPLSGVAPGCLDPMYIPLRPLRLPTTSTSLLSHAVCSTIPRSHSSSRTTPVSSSRNLSSHVRLNTLSLLRDCSLPTGHTVN